ncbi:MAG: HEAT repeat domain-containing protein [Anaerolineae bacterium]
MATPPLHALIADLRGRYAIPRKKAAEALVGLGAAAVPALIETLQHKNPEAQEAAADVLTRIATPDALSAVEQWKKR